MKAVDIVLILGAAGLAGCQSGSARGEMPARIIDPTPESRAELETVVSGALGGEVTLADNALTTDSRLIVERKVHRDVQHGRIMGRDPGQPDQFRLIKQGERCMLVHVGSGRQWELKQARCVAETGSQ